MLSSETLICCAYVYVLRSAIFSQQFPDDDEFVCLCHSFMSVSSSDERLQFGQMG